MRKLHWFAQGHVRTDYILSLLRRLRLGWLLHHFPPRLVRSFYVFVNSFVTIGLLALLAPEAALLDMDRQGVDVQVISLTTPMASWGDEALSHKLANTWNDEAAKAYQANPTRLACLIALPMLFPDRAIDELNRASKLPGMRGVYMGTNVNAKDLDDPMFEPVFAKIETMSLPLFLHPTQLVSTPRLGAFGLNNLLGLPFDTTVAVSHLIFGGVLGKHPKLEINITHGGGALLAFLGRLDQGWKTRPESKVIPNRSSSYISQVIGTLALSDIHDGSKTMRMISPRGPA